MNYEWTLNRCLFANVEPMVVKRRHVVNLTLSTYQSIFNQSSPEDDRYIFMLLDNDAEDHRHDQRRDSPSAEFWL